MKIRSECALDRGAHVCSSHSLGVRAYGQGCTPMKYHRRSHLDVWVYLKGIPPTEGDILRVWISKTSISGALSRGELIFIDYTSKDIYEVSPVNFAAHNM